METWEKGEKESFLTSWPKELWKYSIPTIWVTLTTSETEDLQKLVFPEKNKLSSIWSFADRIKGAALQFPDGFFLRDDQRSPKDSEMFAGGIRPMTDTVEAMMAYLWSERIWRNLKRAVEWHHPITLVVRKWVDLSPEREFRCFVKGGRLIGISQYFYRENYEWIGENEGMITSRIQDLVKTIAPHLPYPDLVVDVHVGEDKVLLIETNPYYLSDPCCFSYEELDSLPEIEQPALRIATPAAAAADEEDLLALLDTL